MTYKLRPEEEQAIYDYLYGNRDIGVLLDVFFRKLEKKKDKMLA